jgi:hypothetical protein
VRKTKQEKPHSNHQPHHGVAAPLRPPPFRGHRRMRLVVLFIYVQGIDLGVLQSPPNSRILCFGRRLPATIPAAVVPLRRPRPHQRLRGELAPPLDAFPLSFASVFCLSPWWPSPPPQDLAAGKVPLTSLVPAPHLLVQYGEAHPRSRITHPSSLPDVDFVSNQNRPPWLASVSFASLFPLCCSVPFFWHDPYKWHSG